MVSAFRVLWTNVGLGRIALVDVDTLAAILVTRGRSSRDTVTLVVSIGVSTFLKIGIGTGFKVSTFCRIATLVNVGTGQKIGRVFFLETSVTVTRVTIFVVLAVGIDTTTVFDEALVDVDAGALFCIVLPVVVTLAAVAKFFLLDA